MFTMHYLLFFMLAIAVTLVSGTSKPNIVLLLRGKRYTPPLTPSTKISDLLSYITSESSPSTSTSQSPKKKYTATINGKKLSPGMLVSEVRGEEEDEVVINVVPKKVTPKTIPKSKKKKMVAKKSKKSAPKPGSFAGMDSLLASTQSNTLLSNLFPDLTSFTSLQTTLTPLSNHLSTQLTTMGINISDPKSLPSTPLDTLLLLQRILLTNGPLASYLSNNENLLTLRTALLSNTFISTTLKSSLPPYLSQLYFTEGVDEPFLKAVGDVIEGVKNMSGEEMEGVCKMLEKQSGGMGMGGGLGNVMGSGGGKKSEEEEQEKSEGDELDDLSEEE